MIPTPEIKPEVISDFPHQIIDIPTVWIPLSDGTRLAARIWRPVDAEQHPVPAILEHIPYRRRDGTLSNDEQIHPYFAGHGFAAVRVDMRGSGDSEGLLTDEYLKLEHDDALEIIAWLAAQPWCDGNVGMMGISWGGFNSLQVAARAPDALKAIIAVGATVDRYNDDVHYKNGCLLNENFAWGSTFLSFCSRPPDPEIVGERWREMWLERLENQTFFPEIWLSHQLRDEYWKHGSVCETYDAIKAPVMIITGWADAYVNAVPRLLENLNVPCRAIGGPWTHQYPHLATPGPKIDFLGEAVRWWTHWLKGNDTGIMEEPAYLAYCQEGTPPNAFAAEVPGRWIAASSWPSSDMSPQVLYLTADGLSAQEAPAPICVVHSPLDVGTAAGEFIAQSAGPEMPQDQRVDDAGSLLFDGAALSEALDIWGDPVLELTLSSNCQTGHLIARLCDVAPDGSSERVTFGTLDLTHRHGNEEAIPMSCDEPVKIRLPLDHVAHRFPAGHKIRLALSTAYWPLIWPAKENPTLTLAPQPATLTLPVRDNVPDQPDIAPAGATVPKIPNIVTHRPGRHLRQSIQEQGQQASSFNILDDYGDIEFADHGTIYRRVRDERHRLRWNDPLSATQTIHWTHELRRKTWHVRTETFTHMECDEETYYLTGRVEAYEGEIKILERSWEKTIKRC